LKDSVKNVSQANAAVLRRYKNQIAGLEAINARLLDEVDSLKMEEARRRTSLSSSCSSTALVSFISY
jgi:uncharacterized protein (DUF885 family)